MGMGSFILGGALQGAGAGMFEQLKEAALERRDQALLEARGSYTLGPGEVRYDNSGKEIARGPDRAPDVPGIGDELIAAGYKPGTPEYQEAITSVINGKYGSDYVDARGDVRRRSPLNLAPASGRANSQSGAAGESPNQQQNGAFTFEMYQGAVNGLGKQDADAWLSRNGLAVQVATPEEARQLPSGTRIILPDGSEGRVP